MEKYLKSGDRILEIGAGTGRYSHALARKGYVVDAIELVQHNIEVFKQNTMVEEKITITKGDALDLSSIEYYGVKVQPFRKNSASLSA